MHGKCLTNFAIIGKIIRKFADTIKTVERISNFRCVCAIVLTPHLVQSVVLSWQFLCVSAAITVVDGKLVN